MFCPTCGAEYVPGVHRCPDCDTQLIAEAPTDEVPESPQWEAALETGDPALLAAAESLLLGAEFPYRKRNEGLQDLFALGRLGMGFNPVVGPVFLDVPAERLAEAREILASLEEYRGLDEDELPSG